DVYVLPVRPIDDTFEGWPSYLPEVPAPVFALEVVSESNWRKDYVSAPQRYAVLGTRELVLYDPQVLSGTSPASMPVLLQLYRRTQQGAMQVVYRGEGLMWSEVLEAWLHVHVDELRLSRDKEGEDGVMTPEEGEAWWKRRSEVESAR